MKRTLPILSVAILLMTAFVFVMTSCGSKSNTNAGNSMTLSAADTAGLADFQEWKAQNERKEPSLYYNPSATTTAAKPVAKKTTSTKTVATKPAATSSTTSTASKKKGWSKAAKGAVIGTATGAAAGAIINKKNRVLGGVIGGVIGGGVGYGIGRHMDKKDGRY
jgi:hypothetical protein